MHKDDFSLAQLIRDASNESARLLGDLTFVNNMEYFNPKKQNDSKISEEDRTRLQKSLQNFRASSIELSKVLFDLRLSEKKEVGDSSSIDDR